MRKTIVFFALLGLVASGAVAQSSVGDVWFAESTTSIAVGVKCVTNVYVNTGTQKLAAYTFELSYNAAVLALDTSYGTNGVSPGAEGFVTVVMADLPGKCTISSFDVAGKGPSVNLHLLSIQWSGVAAGFSTVTNLVSTLSDVTTAIIGNPYGKSIQVIVGLLPTLSPTPTRTVTPTPPCVHTFGPWTPDGPEGHKRYCTKCGLREKTAHVYGSWEDVGYRGHQRTCTVCGFIDGIFDHVYGSWESDGPVHHKRICSRCNHVDWEDHNYGGWISAGPSGHIHYCLKCRYPESEPHDFGGWVPDGTGGEKRYCTLCGAKETR